LIVLSLAKYFTMKLLPHVILLFVVSLISGIAIGQKQFAEGSLLYNISISSSKSQVATSNALNGATFHIFLRPTQSRTEMTTTLGCETTVFDSKTAVGFILKEYSGQKLLISLNGANWKEKNMFNENLKFDISDEFFQIGDYKCKRATTKSTEAKRFTVYFNPEIVIVNKQYNNAFSQIPGIAVQIEMQSGDMNYKYVLSKMSYDLVSGSKFESPKAGYRTMTYEEGQKIN
jgi:hypothetical protein